MYRGLPPNGRLLSVSLSDQKKMKIGQFSKVKVGKLEPFAKNFIDDRTKAITLNLFTVGKGTVSHMVKFEGSHDAGDTDFRFMRQDVLIEIHEADEPVVRIEISEEKSNMVCCLFPSTKLKTHGPFASDIISFPTTEDISNIVFTDFEIPLLFLNIESRIDNAVFNIEPGKFSECVIPTEIEKLWGPLPIERLPDGWDTRCLAVTHKLSRSSQMEISVTVCILHSVPLCMSAVQVRPYA